MKTFGLMVMDATLLWVNHTKLYYRGILVLKNVKMALLAAFVMAACLVSVVAYASVTDVATTWILSDALDIDMMMDEGDAVFFTDGSPIPPESVRGAWTLQKPTELGGYFDEVNFENLFAQSELALREDDMSADFLMPMEDDWEVFEEGATEFITGNPGRPTFVNEDGSAAYDPRQNWF